jgi:hypothetical protein
MKAQNYKKAFIALALIFCMAGCTDNSARVMDVSNVLAAVSGQKITQAQLDYQLSKISGISEQEDTQAVRQKMLESLVLAKLMAHKQSQTMSHKQRQQLEIEVNAYREERLVHHYLNQNIEAKPPTSQQVNDFYQTNKQRFGGGIYAHSQTFLLSDDCQLDDSVSSDAVKLKASLQATACQSNKTRKTRLVKDLAKTMNVTPQDLKPGTPLWLMSDRGQTITFIEKIETRQAKPMVEVASDIRKMLAPAQLRMAIAKTRVELLKETDVEYFE